MSRHEGFEQMNYIFKYYYYWQTLSICKIERTTGIIVARTRSSGPPSAVPCHTPTPCIVARPALPWGQWSCPSVLCNDRNYSPLASLSPALRQHPIAPVPVGLDSSYHKQTPV